MVLSMCWLPSGRGFHGYAMSSLTAAMQVINCDPRLSAWASGLSTSSSVPTKPRASRCYRADGLSSEPSLGLGAVEGWQRIGKGPSRHPPHGPSSPQSACSRAEPQDTVKFDQLLNRALMALFSPMFCGGGCSTIGDVMANSTWLSPILLMLSASTGIIGFSNPSWRLLIIAMVSPALAALPFCVSGH